MITLIKQTFSMELVNASTYREQASRLWSISLFIVGLSFVMASCFVLIASADNQGDVTHNAEMPADEKQHDAMDLTDPEGGKDQHCSARGQLQRSTVLRF